nr:MAG TPA: hypothetical protein [Caudoviricetes sp.]
MIRSFVILQLYLLRPGFFFRQSLAVLLSRQEMIVERVFLLRSFRC